MRKIIIASDSTCDLSEELINKYDIKIIPLYINVNEVSYKDGVDIKLGEMFEMVDKKVGFPKTSAPTPEDFESFFRPFIEDDCDIIYTGIASSMSCTLQNAKIAADEFPEGRIYLVDSQNLSTGIGLILLKAAKYRDAGLDARQIVAEMEDIIPRVRSQFVVNTLEYLHKGGRCSGIILILSTALLMKPMIKVTSGKMVVAKKTLGSIRKGINGMIEEFLELSPNVDRDFLFVTHARTLPNVEYILDKINSVKDEFKEVNVTEAGCVISSHCGPSSIGILYIVK